MSGYPGIPAGCVCAYMLQDGRWRRLDVSDAWGCLADHREVVNVDLGLLPPLP